MDSKHVQSLAGALIGALVGVFFTGVAGAVVGGVAGWFIPIGLSYASPRQTLNRKIVKALSSPNALQVRDIMRSHGLEVPIDCFDFSPAHPFVRNLVRYRSSLIELEAEGRVFYSPSASALHGYVDPPNDWVNMWAGRAYHV